MEQIGPYGPLLILGSSFLIAGSLLVYSLQAVPLLWDEWGMVVRASNLNGAGAIPPGGDLASTGSLIRSAFEPWNGHLLAFGIFSTALLTSLFGLSSFSFVAFTLLGALLISITLYFYAKGRLGPWLALLPALVPLFFAGGSEFFGPGVQFTPVMGPNGIYSLLFGIWALILVDRRSTTGDVGATVLLALSLSSFSYGAAFLAGVATAILLAPRPLKRIYIVGLPFVLYLFWWVWARETFGASNETFALSNLLVLPAYFFDSFSAVVTAFFGLTLVGAGQATSLQFGAGSETTLQLLALLILMCCFILLLVWHTVGCRFLRHAAFWPPFVTLISMWALQGVFAELVTRMPGSPRYLFAGAVLLALVSIEVFRGVSLSRPAILVVCGLAATALLANTYRFIDTKHLIDRWGQETRVTATALELARNNLSPDFVPARDLNGFSASFWIDANTYGTLVNRYGLLGEGEPYLLTLPPDQRRITDQILVGAQAPRLEEANGPSTDCRRLPPGDLLKIDVGTLKVRAWGPDTRLYLGRYYDRPSVLVGTLSRGERATLTIPRDQSLRPWVLRSTQPLGYCP